MQQRLLVRIDQKKGQLDSLRPLPISVIHALRERFSIEWTYNSNAIEGNSLSLRETQLVLQEGLTIRGKSLREHFEVQNHERAIQYVESLVNRGYKLKKRDIFEIHRLVLENIDQEFGGRYRTGRVRILGANFVPPNPMRVSDHMEEFIQVVNRNPGKNHIVQHIARMHHRFVWIHPFFDGNGRTGRLLMNLLFMKYGYPPAVILKNDRKKYYNALNQANNEQYEKIELLIGQSLERSLDMYLEACGGLKDDNYILLSELSKQFPYSQEYLSLLAREGKIDAIKEKRNWLSTKYAIEEYVRNRSRKR